MVGRIRHKTPSNITVVLAPTLAWHWWHEHGLLVTPNTKISTVCDRQARHLNVFDTSNPANNHSQNSVSKLGTKPTEHFWTQSWTLRFYLDLLHLSDRTHVLRQLVIFIKLPSNEIPLLTKWLKNPSRRSRFPCILSWTHSCSDKIKVVVYPATMSLRDSAAIIYVSISWRRVPQWALSPISHTTILYHADRWNPE